MSAFAGMNFGLRISAKDETQGAIRSAMASVSGFARAAARPIMIPLQIARGGLGLLRDINLGLRPLVAGLDTLITRGSGLEVVTKSFESLTGVGGAKAQMLARSLVDAASGTLRLGEAMQIANRALGSGLSFAQLGTAIEFISKKSISTGKDANQALQTVITGLSRGSTLFLDDFGILVDGIDGVRRSFDQIHGEKAFDQLGPAAQKAEVIREAISEMQQQMGRIGVTGKETVFVWSRIKNEIGDATDKLVLAAAGSKGMRDALGGLRDMLSGISQHFEKGGSFGELLTGKGKSGGLLGLAKGALIDAGSAIGRGIAGAALLGLAKLPNLLKTLINEIGPTLGKAWGAFITSPFVKELRALREETIERLGQSFADWLPFTKKDAQGNVTEGWLEKVFQFFEALPRMPRRFFQWAGQNTSDQMMIGAGTTPIFRSPLMTARAAIGASAMGQTGGGGFTDMMRRAGRSLLSGGVYGGDSAFIRQKRGFDQDFEARGFVGVGDAMQEGGMLDRQPQIPYELRPQARNRLKREAAALDRQADRLIRGRDTLMRAEAGRRSLAEYRRLQREGFRVGPRELNEIRERTLRQMGQERAAPLLEQARILRERQGDSDILRRRRGMPGLDNRDEKQVFSAISLLTKEINELKSVFRSGIQQLVGGNAELARAGAGGR